MRYIYTYDDANPNEDGSYDILSLKWEQQGFNSKETFVGTSERFKVYRGARDAFLNPGNLKMIPRVNKAGNTVLVLSSRLLTRARNKLRRA